jgi:mannose-1-phosphate guanylyltransferase/mannose-6-phosphate isomerase
MKLGDELSLFQRTVVNVKVFRDKDERIGHPCLLMGQDVEHHVSRELRDIKGEISCEIIEPIARGTAAALTLAALSLSENHADPILLVIPADHRYSNIPGVLSSLDLAFSRAETGSIVLLGVTPTHPDTGYGYIRIGTGEQGFFPVECFDEKPPIDRATEYCKADKWFWNSGLLVIRASVWIDVLGILRPDILSSVKESWAHRIEDGEKLRIDKEAYLPVPNETIESAVTTKAVGEEQVNVEMVLFNAQWADLGTWNSIWQFLEKDDDQNLKLGDVISVDSTGCIGYVTDQLLCLVGLKDVAIIEANGAILAINRNNTQMVRQLMNDLVDLKGSSVIQSSKHIKPWGWFKVLYESSRVKVKLISIDPGGRLSLQRHMNRAEYWFPISGEVEVVVDNSKFIIGPTESTFIEKGQIHRVSNYQESSVEFIEVQLGDYLGEDDIVRYEDIYSRTS